MQTVAGDGFTFQAPADWTVLKTPGSASVMSPIDISQGTPGIGVTVSIIPAPPPLVPADMVSTMLDSDRSNKTVESESEVTLAGRTGTRLVTVQTSRVDESSDATSSTRHIKFYLPLEARFLLLQVTGPDEYVLPLMPQVDAIIQSIAIQ